jgi:hypothetical protein
MTTEDYIINECESLKLLLLNKNRLYGDTAARPGFPYKLPASTAIKARINDKLGRLSLDHKDEDEDLTQDILGYLILLRIAIRKEKEGEV